MRATHVGLWVVPLVLAACGERGATPPGVESRVQLLGFESCDALEGYIEDSVTQDMESYLRRIRDGEWGWVRGAEDAAPNAAAMPGSSAAPAAYTTTNTQVAGVDEADFVKNDGTRIFVLSGHRLLATRSWPPQSLALAGSLEIEGWPREMYLDEQDRVVVISQVEASTEPGPGGARECGFAECYWYWSGTTKLTVVDVSNLAAPAVLDEVYLPGSYDGSRRIGTSVRVVLSDWFRYPAGLRYYPEYDPADPDKYQNKALLAAALELLRRDNERLIRAQRLEDWLAKGRRRLRDGRLVDVSYACTDFARASSPVRPGVVTIATLDLADLGKPPARTSLIAEPGELYATTQSLYIASQHWWWWPALGQSDWTYVHKFDISSPSGAVHVASGCVAGHIVDQFSLDEHDGYRRLATTTATRVADPNLPWGRLETANRISVLAESGGALTLVGQTPPLAAGERIFSSRFLGDKGYLVTFRQVDPFFTFDLSDPRQPRAVGELKVPGFSTYLHPIDDDHLLTIGVYQPEPDQNGNVDWQQRRMKLSLFDVSDFAHPVERATQLVGTAYGWSEAAYEHKAFNWFADKQLLAIPFSDYARSGGVNYWDSFVSELRVFHVDAATGITPRGALSMHDVYLAGGAHDWRWWYSPFVRRSVMASDADGHTFVYAIADAGLRVADLAAITQPLATVLFPQQSE